MVYINQIRHAWKGVIHFKIRNFRKRKVSVLNQVNNL